MSAEPPTIAMDHTAGLRRSVYLLLICIAVGMVTGQTLPQNTHADNDRSRWVTMRALVEDSTYVVGLRVYFDEAGTVYEDQGLVVTKNWESIDKVLKPEPGWRNENPKPGEPLFARYYYSSKPPLLATVLAGKYWLLNRCFGWSLADDSRWYVIRTILFTTNTLPWLIALCLLSRLIDQLGTTDFGRIAAVAAACFCTFLSTFAVTLNNHTVAAWAVVFAIYPVVKAEVRQQALGFLPACLAGLGAGWAATNELPALAFVGLLGLWILVRRPAMVVPYALGAMVPLGGLLLTNYLAIGTLVPAYEKFGTEWYQYHGSHWSPEKLSGIDKPKDSTPVYLFHLTFGHHGLFSLTPFLLIALAGMARPRMGVAVSPSNRRVRTILGWGTLFLSLVILSFYLSKTESYNYGGWTSGPRWFFWLTPLWVLGAIPPLDVLAKSRWGRGIILIVLAWSAMSVAFPYYNPWRHPWLFRFLEHLGWIQY
jgi:hypothetical protein